MRRAARTKVAALALLASVMAWSSCSHAPTEPSGGGIDVSGQWAGAASDTTGFGDMLWRLTQSGSTFTGTAEITDRGLNITGLGTVFGSSVAGALQFTLVVPSGGFGAPFEACSTTVTGEATAGATSLAGTYTGTSTCGGRIYAGQMVLRRL